MRALHVMWKHSREIQELYAILLKASIFNKLINKKNPRNYYEMGKLHNFGIGRL